MGVSQLVPDVIDRGPVGPSITATPVEAKPSYDDLFPELTEKQPTAQPSKPVAHPQPTTAQPAKPEEQETVTLRADQAKRLLKAAWVLENQTIDAQNIVNEWEIDHPAFVRSEENWHEMINAMIEADMPVTAENLTIAYKALDSQKLLQHNEPLESVQTDELQISNDVRERTRREQARAEQLHREFRPVRTGIMESSVTPPPAPSTSADSYNAVAEDISRMPLEQARLRMQQLMREARNRQ